MANYSNLKSAIQQVIKANGNNEITGAILQSSLVSMITSLGDGYQFKGVATTATTPPSTPDQRIFYLAGAGTYSNFGSGMVVPEGYIGAIKYDSAWSLSNVKVSSNQDYISINRGNVTINNNTVTLGVGYYYFYKHDGTEVAVYLSSPQSFTLVGDGVLTYNFSTSSFSSHDKGQTTDNEVILLLYDGVKGFDNYGTLWGTLTDRNNISILNKLNDLNKISVVRPNIVLEHSPNVHGVVTLGAGNYYFYKHDGGEILKSLSSTQSFTLESDYVLTYDFSDNNFKCHAKESTTTDEIILLIWDRLKGFDNYGTLWSLIACESTISAAITELKNSNFISINRGEVTISSNVVTLGAGYYYFYKHDGTEIVKHLDSSQSFTFSGDYVLTYDFSDNNFKCHAKESTVNSESILLIYDGVKGFDNYGTLWSSLVDKLAISNNTTAITSLISPSFVRDEANTTYQRFVEYIDGKISSLAFISDIHNGIDSDIYKHYAYLSDLNKLFGFNVIVNGGDIGLDVGETETQSTQLIDNTKYSMGDNAIWLFCKGNHDYGTQNVPPIKLDEALNGAIRRKFSNRIIIGENGTTNVGFGYTDDTDNKVRFIYLNTADGSGYYISTFQLQWLITTLSAIPSDYKVVISMHRCPEHFADWVSYPTDVTGDCWDAIRAILPAFIAKTSGSNTALGISWDFTQVATSVKLICVMCGDAHFNAFQKINGVNYIVRQGYGGISQSEMPTGATKDDFSYTTQCSFDVLVVKDGGNAKVFRIGAGGETRDLEITY